MAGFQLVPEVSVTAEDSSSSSSSDDEGAVAQKTAAPAARARSPVVIRNLPGPSQVLGDQGNSGTNPLTGQRQRRRGVSGPPTGE